MSKRFKTYRDGKTIKLILYNPFKGWGKFTLAVYFLTIVIASWLSIDQIILDMITHENLIYNILIITGALLILNALILRSILRNANEYEVLILDVDHLLIQKGFGWFKKTKQFKIKEIENLRFREEKEKADHSLKTESFDYLGFQTEQKVIDEFYKDDRIKFDYRGKNFSFGKDIMNWEFEELLSILQTKLDFDLNQITKTSRTPCCFQ